MRVLVDELPSVMVLPSSPVETISTTLKSVVIRPRLEGEEGAMRGAAMSALLADRGVAIFTIRPLATTGGTVAANAALAIASLNQLQAFLTLKPIPLLGANIDSAGFTSFPFPEVDVTGQLVLFRGRLVYDLQSLGVVSAELRLVNRAATDLTVLITQQIFADVRTRQNEFEKDGVINP